MESLREFIKSRKRNRIYRYSIRRLSIGVVSCVVGAFVLFGPVNFGKTELSGVIYAAEEKPSEDFTKMIQVFSKNEGDIFGNSFYLSNFLDSTGDINKEKSIELLKKLYDKYEKFALENKFGTDMTSKFIKILQEDGVKTVLKDNGNSNSLFEHIKNKIKARLENELEKIRDDIEQKRDSYLSSPKIREDYWSVISSSTSKFDKLEKSLEQKLKDLENSNEKNTSKLMELNSISKDIDKFESELNEIINTSNKDYNIKKKKAAINNFEYLSDEEKEIYITGVETSQSSNSVNIAFEIAEERNEEKKKIAEEISELKHLNDKDKEMYIHALKTATGMESAKISLELAQEKDEAAKAVNQYRKRPIQKNFEKAYDLTNGKYEDLYEKLIEAATYVQKATDNLTDAWRKEDKDEAKRQKSIIQAKKELKDSLKKEMEDEKKREKDLENKWQEEANKHKEEQDKKEKPVEPKQPDQPKKPEEKPVEPKQPEEPKKPEQPREKEKEVIPATPLTPGIKVIPSTPLQPSIRVVPRAFRNDNDQRGSIDWRYIKAPSKDTKTEVQKQKTVIEVKIKIGSDILQRTINNHTQEIKMDTTAFIKDGRTMLPIRYVAEALGYTVEWREDTRTAILKDKNTTIEIPVDTNKIIVNGKEIQSDVKPMIENGRTMLPIANVARALGLKDGQDIKWDEAKQEVTIRKEIIN